ncbi:MAG TPA: hypothetical protein VFK07_01805 [Candidatus Paceibacterota bacterium]|nr:hypothetical protein [Candidatus Paceibacterota bacterium]
MRITSIFIGLAVVFASGLIAFSPAQAYYVQPYLPTSYAYPSYGYGYGQPDLVSSLIRGEVNFVSSFTFVPQPVPLYFYNPPMPFAYPYNFPYGWRY